ncbi:hypothetical protein [Burkholderia cepacia]|uniref:hypothetical protein n=1 Tax=Burkholderia cepacia TaxID=292 RepID=UPI0010FDE2AE|nr:hypothetical protein [Burkholderia cepacia]MCA8464332.1 hypothetical protein [Burkholderia cepacia]MDN7761154.1 hypothetical protein [Burkholderia cepacia]QCY06842.1 hypothetical protein EJ998_28045 [Burkholderia cepacia ATCC 25416]
MSADELLNALREIAEEGWASHRDAVLLSALPKKLDARMSTDYRVILGAQSLKKLIINRGPANGVRLVEHPTQRAKLGIVPAGVDFQFPSPEPAALSPETISEHDISGFVRVMETLTQDEIRQVSFPASFIVRLLGKK